MIQSQNAIKQIFIYLTLVMIWINRGDIFAEGGYLAQTVGADIMGWIEKGAILCIVGGVGYFVWKRARLAYFKHKVKAGTIQPIIADGIVQEIAIKSYDNGYRRRGKNASPNYDRSCTVQWIVPGFGEMKEGNFTFNFLQTILPQSTINMISTKNNSFYNLFEKALPQIIIDKNAYLHTSSKGPVMQFLQEHIKIGEKLPVIIHPENIDLYYIEDPLTQYKDQINNKNAANIDTNIGLKNSIAIKTIKRFVILPTVIIIGGGILLLLFAIGYIYL